MKTYKNICLFIDTPDTVGEESSQEERNGHLKLIENAYLKWAKENGDKYTRAKAVVTECYHGWMDGAVFLFKKGAKKPECVNAFGWYGGEGNSYVISSRNKYRSLFIGDAMKKLRIA